MSEESQAVIPPSFVALFVPPGRLKPTASREDMSARHELCEDLAMALTERARNLLWDLGVTEADVLERVRRGLLEAASGVSRAEADWVTCRLAELLDWELPAFAGRPGE